MPLAPSAAEGLDSRARRFSAGCESAAIMSKSKAKKKNGSQVQDGGLVELSLHDPRFQKLLLALHTATKPKAFLKAAERLIHGAVRCDVVHTLLHFRIERGANSVAWGSDGSVFSNEHVRGSLEGNPINWLHATKPDTRFSTLEACYPSVRQMEEDPFFEKWVLAVGVQHATTMPFAGGDLSFSPQRAPGRPEFSRDDAAILEALYPHIDLAYRRMNRLQTESGALLGLEQCLDLLPLPMIVVDWHLAPLFFNESAQDALVRWRGISPHLEADGLEVPANLRAALQAMREEWTTALRDVAGIATLPERIVEHPTKPEWRARISMTTMRSPHFGQPSFIVRLESTSPGRSEKLATLARFSPAERRLVQRVCEGESNQEIADGLGRCLNTVKSELHTVFTKLGVRSRARLMALLR